MKMRPSNRASRVEMPGNRLRDRVPSDEYPPTCAADLAVFGHCHPTLAAFSRTEWLTNNPRSAADDQGTRQLQANAQAKRSGIAPAQIVGEPEQARSHSHDQGAYVAHRCDALERKRSRHDAAIPGARRRGADYWGSGATTWRA